MIDKAKGYHLGRDWVGNGLLTNSGDHWRLKRKLLTPAFSFQMLSAFRGPMENCINILIERLSEIADGQPHDIQEYPLLLSMDVICGRQKQRLNDSYNFHFSTENRDRDGHPG